MKYYNQTIENIAQYFQVNLDSGLPAQEAQDRLNKFGCNKLKEEKHEPIYYIFLGQFANPLIYILLAAAAIIFFIGDKLDAFIITGVLTFNAIIGTIQEGRTRKILDSLKNFVPQTCTVIRDNKKSVINTADLVPGDIVVLQEGEKIPADGRVITSNLLKVDQAILTGESIGVEKVAHEIFQENNSGLYNNLSSNISRDISGEISVIDQTNMLFKGTYILSGNGTMLVTSTGQNCEIGKIQCETECIETDMPLKRELDKLSHVILIFIILICAFLLVIGLLQGKSFNDLLVMLTALFICVVPEGLPVIFTVILVSGAYKMAKESVLVKRLQAVEALGRTEIIVVDKTGTLTKNETMVHKVFVDNKLYTVTGSGYLNTGDILYNNKILNNPDNLDNLNNLETHEKIYNLKNYLALINNSEIWADPKTKINYIKGDPIDAAINVFTKKFKLDKVNNLNYKIIFELPFNTQTRLRFFVVESPDLSYKIFSMGAPEAILNICEKNINNINNNIIKNNLDNFLQDGLRVVACAQLNLAPDFAKATPGRPSSSESANLDDQIANDPLALSAQETLQGFLSVSKGAGLIKNNLGNFEFSALIALQDAIREDVQSVISRAKSAGVDFIMITGDHPSTAKFVAKSVGIMNKDQQIITGQELDKLSNREFFEKINNIKVFARVTPSQKLKIIELLKYSGKTVAMVGDGVNDAPALVAADLGISMGQIGTEVAKQASDIILLDDKLSSILVAMQQGRHIFYTLRRVVLYFFATNFGEILVVLFAFILNLDLPILAAQILWLNLVTDGFLDLALAAEPVEKNLLEKSWLRESLKKGLIDPVLIIKVIYMAIPMALGSIYLFYQNYQTDLVAARTMTLVCMAMFQWYNAWNCRSENLSLFQIGIFSNFWLVLATSFVLILQYLVTTVPFLQYIFKTVPLSFSAWAQIFLVSSSILIFEELRKYFVRLFYKNL